MRILFVFNHPAPYKVFLLNELSSTFDMDVVFERKSAKDRNPEFYNLAKLNFKPIYVKGISFGNENFYSNKIIKLIKNNHYDLIIMNGYSTLAEVKTIFYLQKKKIPYVLYINGGIVHDSNRIKVALKKKLISKASSYISPCESADDYLFHYGAKKESIYHYPYSTVYKKNILNKELSSEEKEKIKTELGIKGSKIFVDVGQFIDRKNQMFLLNLWSKLPKDYSLLLIGGGKKKDEFSSFIKEHNLTNVYLIDFLSRDHIFTYFHIADAFLFPSKEDIYGHVITEAMSQGLPIISTPYVVSALTLVKNNTNGYILPFNENEWLEKIKKINKKMGEESLNIVESYTVEKSVEVHVDIFNKLGEKK